MCVIALLAVRLFRLCLGTRVLHRLYVEIGGVARIVEVGGGGVGVGETWEEVGDDEGGGGEGREERAEGREESRFWEWRARGGGKAAAFGEGGASGSISGVARALLNFLATSEA